ncbi:MAG: nucleoside triphosphate pyrophosphatase [Rickettsiales bacterium]
MRDEKRPDLILASTSPSRAALLRAAGLDFKIEPADIDESAIKERCRLANATVSETAALLSLEKARKISERRPAAFVIGSDQMLECDGKWLDKPSDVTAAAETLRTLRGRTHRLITCVSVLYEAVEIWSHTETAVLTMRRFSDDFLARYIETGGEKLLTSVGAYQLEGHGAQLFETIEGDYFTILGLPLLPLLAFLRARHLIPA